MLSPTQRIMAKAMIRGQTVSARQMIDMLYAHRPDGGPDDPGRTVRDQVYKMRQKLGPLGIEIQSVGQRNTADGWRLAPESIERLGAILET